MTMKLSDLGADEIDALLFCKECNDIVEQVIVDFDIYQCGKKHLNFAPVDTRQMDSTTDWYNKRRGMLGQVKIAKYKKKLQGE